LAKGNILSRGGGVLSPGFRFMVLGAGYPGRQALGDATVRGGGDVWQGGRAKGVAEARGAFGRRFPVMKWRQLTVERTREGGGPLATDAQR
jgi:hypothetical protein